MVINYSVTSGYTLQNGGTTLPTTLQKNDSFWSFTYHTSTKMTHFEASYGYPPLSIKKYGVDPLL